MNKNTISLLALALTSTLPLSAQTANSTYTVKGMLCDSLTREPEAYATVRLLSLPAGKPVKVTTTNDNGSFAIGTNRSGKYTLELVSLGKQPVRRTVSLGKEQSSLQLDTLYIKEYDTTLGTATVTAQRPLVKADLDKLTYSLADDPDTPTSTVLEMLRKVPMVSVDGEDNIKVNGNSSFKVYVDGKPNAMMSANPSMIFKAYPASSIQKIEVITNPGAKYDAEGVAGVLNIITNGNSHTSGYTLTPNFSIGNQNLMGGLFGMAQFGKFMVSAHYGIGYTYSPEGTSVNEREVFGEEVNHLLRTEGVQKNRGVFQFGNIDASYDISKKDLLSMSAGIHGWKGTSDQNNLTHMYNTAGETVYSYRSRSHNKMLYQGIDASADYQHSFTDNTKLTLSYNFDMSPQVNKANTDVTDLFNLPENFGLKDMHTDPDKRGYEHTAQADFTTELAKIHTLSFGAKYINRINRSNSTEYSRLAGTDADFVLDEEKSIRYRHQGDIAAAYVEYALKTGHFSLMAGSRYEYYHVGVKYPDGKRPSFSSKMNDWVPSLSVGWNLAATTMVKAGYNLRIGRPDIGYLSPYVESYTPEYRTYGNPDLGSEKAHNLNLSFSSFTSKLSLNASLTYSFSNNGLTSYSFMQDGVHNTTYGNFLHSKITSLSTFMNWNIAKGTKLNLSASGSYSDYKTHVTGDRNWGFAGNVWGGFTQELPWKLKADLWGGGGTPDISLQGKGSGYHFYSLSLSRSFLNDDALTVSLHAGNFIGRYTTFRSSTQTDQFRTNSENRRDGMRLGIGIRFKLGQLKASVKKVDRSIQNDDVMQGGSGNGGMQQGEQGAHQ